MGDARVFQEAVDAAIQGQTTDARVFQEPVEVGVTDQTTDSRVFAQAVEVALLIAGSEPILPTSITSGGAFGTPTVYDASIHPGSIASSEAVGSPTVTLAARPSPTSISSEEAFGTPVVTGQGYVAPTSIATGEAFGAVVVRSPRKISPVSIAPADAEGFPNVSGVSVGKKLTIKLGPGHRGIPSRETFGTPKVTPGVVKPAAIGSAGAVGSPHIVIAQTVLPSSIASSEAVGTPSLARPGTVIPPSIPTGEAVGTPRIVRAGTIDPTAIVSSEAFGTPTLVTLEQLVLPSSIASSEVVNAPTVLRAGSHVLAPGGIGTGAAFGTPTIVIGPNAPITPPSIVPLERFGLPRITVGIPQGPVNQPPGRIANRLYDPETGVAFAFAINHTTEDPRSFDRQYEAGAPGPVGLSRQQSPGEPFHLSFHGTILDPAQKGALDALFEHCDTSTLIYEDYSGEAYEVIIGTWDCREERARNPFTRGLHLWRYNIDLVILRTWNGPVRDVLGDPIQTPADITVLVPPTLVLTPPRAQQPSGIASLAGLGRPTVIGGSIVVVPSAIMSSQAFGGPVLSGGDIGGVPAAYPSRLAASGTRITDANGVPLSTMTGVNVQCFPTSIPAQADLDEIAANGGSWVRIVLHWSDQEPTQGVWNTAARDSLDILLQRVEAAGLYAMIELHLNTGAVPSWTSGADETAKYANGGEFITRAIATRHGANKVVMGFGPNELPLGDSTIRNGNNAIPYLEGVQRDMISWFRAGAPDWIGFVCYGYANQTPYPVAPRTPADPNAFDIVGANVVVDVHHYGAGVNSSDPNHDSRQDNGTIWATWQGGPAIWQNSDYPISYADTAVHRSQIYAFLADYVSFCLAAQIPLMVGEVGWTLNNTGGESAYWDALLEALLAANPAMVAQWVHSTKLISQGEYWASKPGGVWRPGVLRLLAGPGSW